MTEIVGGVNFFNAIFSKKMPIVTFWKNHYTQIGITETSQKTEKSW